MPNPWVLQTNLTGGELSPLLAGQLNLQSYYNGLETETNMLSIPQGGAKKRPGMEYLATALGDGRVEPFSFNTEQNYLIVFTNGKMRVLKDGVVVVLSGVPSTWVTATSYVNSDHVRDVAGNYDYYCITDHTSGATTEPGVGASWQTYWHRLERSGTTSIVEVPIPYTLAQIQVFDYIQSADTIIIFHEDVETRVISRTSDTAWTIETAPFTNIWQYDFNDSSSPTPTSQIQEITFSNSDETGDRFKISLNDILTEEIVYNDFTALRDDNAISTENAIQNALLRHPLTSNNPADITVTNTSVSPSKFDVTFSGGSANDWDVMAITYIYTTASSVVSTATITQAGTARTEDTWSTTRGWPRTGTFHEGRLWIGGSKSRPNVVWGSYVNDFFNFDRGRSFDNESIEATLDTDQLNAVNAIFSNRSLQVFTTGGEFYENDSPITPENVSFKPQTNMGAKRVRPVTIDGVTLFVQETGKSIIQFLYLDENQANQASSISFMSEHLIKNPVQMAVRRGTSGEDANYVFINNDDGTLVVFNTMVTQEVAGFSEWQTAQDSSSSSSIKSIAVVDKELYTLVEREIDGSTVYLIEKETSDCFLDSSVTVSGASATISGLDHLEGETVVAMADNAYMGEFTVSSGSITLPRASVSTRSAGLFYAPTLKTMPLNVPLQNGPNAYLKKKISRCGISLYQSNGVIVNGERFYDKTIAVNQFDAPEPLTGIYRKYILGWSLETQITITQDKPYNLLVRNIGMEIKGN